jgi:hypothetical protein
MSATANGKTVYQIKWREKGKWQEEQYPGDAYGACERARSISMQHHTKIYVTSTVRYVHARFEGGEQTLHRAMPVFAGDDPL